MAAALKVVLAIVLCTLVVEPLATTSLTCGDVTRQMISCIKYLQTGGTLPPACCNGVRALNSQARTTADRQTACRCLQQAAKSLGSSLKANLAEGLPGRCGVNIPYKISTSTNCNNVK